MLLNQTTNLDQGVMEKRKEWLNEQGVRVIAQRPLRRAVIQPFWLEEKDSTFSTNMTSAVEDTLYHIEVTGATLERWRQYELRLNHVIEHADMTNGLPVVFFTEARGRHNKLLEENPMYQQAWREFQEIRSLLGESVHWP